MPRISTHLHEEVLAQSDNSKDTGKFYKTERKNMKNVSLCTCFLMCVLHQVNNCLMIVTFMIPVDRSLADDGDWRNVCGLLCQLRNQDTTVLVLYAPQGVDLRGGGSS